MAVTKTKNVWVLTEADDVTEARSFRKVRWVCPGGNAGDVCILTDLSGNVIYHGVAWGSNIVDSMDITAKEPFALKVDTLDHGVVYLYE
jgi:hypothetical protein